MMHLHLPVPLVTVTGWPWVLVCLMAHLAAAAPVPVVHAPAPPPPASGVRFSGVFSSQMVLQRDAATAVFGWCGTAGQGAQVFSRCTFAAGATVEVTMSSTADSTRLFTTHTPIAGDGTWKALLPAMGAGGSYSVSAACTHGCGNSSAAVLEDVTFGDLYFCSGQSNMELTMHYTFSRNLTTAAVAAGRYRNIRMMKFDKNPMSSPTFVVNESRWGSAKESSRPGFVWVTAEEAASTPYPMKKNGWGGYNWAFNSTVLHQFSAMCFYFAQALTDELNASAPGGAPPIGLIASAVGGTVIESWMPNSTLDECVHAARDPGNEELYNGMVSPFVNMTLKGFVWCKST